MTKAKSKSDEKFKNDLETLVYRSMDNMNIKHEKMTEDQLNDLLNTAKKLFPKNKDDNNDKTKN